MNFNKKLCLLIIFNLFNDDNFIIKKMSIKNEEIEILKRKLIASISNLKYWLYKNSNPLTTKISIEAIKLIVTENKTSERRLSLILMIISESLNKSLDMNEKKEILNLLVSIFDLYTPIVKHLSKFLTTLQILLTKENKEIWSNMVNCFGIN